jgi:hypothetical protein
MVSLDPANERILEHVGRYRVATRSTVAVLLPGSQPDKRLAALSKAGLLRAHRGLPGTVYQLTKKGAVAAQVSPARSRKFGTQSLMKNLGVLLFCHVPEMERLRVEREQAARALQTELPDAAYCLARVRDRAVLFECYVPSATAPISTVLRHLRKQLHAAKKHTSIAEAVRDLRYGLAVIVATPQRRKAIMDAIRTKQPNEQVPLIKRIRIWVESVDAFGSLLGLAPRTRAKSKTIDENKASALSLCESDSNELPVPAHEHLAEELDVIA